MSKPIYTFTKNLLLVLGGCLVGRLAEAQQLASPPPATTPASAVHPTIPEPVYLLNERFIVGNLQDIVPANIASIMVYKEATDIPPRWRSLATHGIVHVTLKTTSHLKAKPLAAIQRWLRVTGPVAFQLEGQPLEDPALRIVTNAIAGLDVTRPVADEAATVINIRLVHSKPTYHPPGTIMIRGVEGG